MRKFRFSRWAFLALLLVLIPASSFAGVFISVGFAPPVLPVYEQPPCPEPGLMWTPGYWAYGPDGYYWVPGAWVPAPYDGALWTPPWWGFEGGIYMFHPGYWGRHVGYYGGVNYGFGYMGVGFVGGAWRGHEFAYNTAVMRVNPGVVRNVYVDRTIVEHNTIINRDHVAYSGGPHGINHAPGAEERVAMHEQHMQATSFQQQHMQAAQSDHNAYARFNGGRPQNVAAQRPLGSEQHQAPMNRGGFNNAQPRGNNGRGAAQPQYRSAPQQQYRAAPQSQQNRSAQPQQQHAAPQQQQQFHNNAPQQHSEGHGQPHSEGSHGGEHPHGR